MIPTDLQRLLAQSLGIDVSEDNFHTAAARLYEVIWPATEEHKSQLPATKKQLTFARGIGLDLLRADRALAAQRIAARLALMNELALQALDLRPKDRVVLKGAPKKKVEVSCVGKNRRIFIKGWGGQSVWATQVLRKASPNTNAQ